MQRYDLIIVGGGLVGASLAIALKDLPLSIALLDARLLSQPDPRLFALNASSCQFLENLGLFKQLIPHASPIKQVHVSREGYFGSVRLNAHEVNLATLGHVIPAEYIEKVITETLHSLSHVTIYTETRLQTLKRVNEGWMLTTAHPAREKNANSVLHTPFIIGADGSFSTVRQALNIGTQITDYHQSALVTRISLQRSHHHIAYERFNTNGALAMLPLSQHECAAIWSGDTAFITQLMNLSDEDFLQKLQSSFGYRLGRFQHIGQRFVFPLQMIRAETSHVPGALLIGNAAHTLHPVAAQGFNLALYETAILIEKIKGHLKNHTALTPDLFSSTANLIQHQLTMSTQLSHRLAQLTASRSYLINALLQIGMTGFDFLPFIKKSFIKKILGQSNLTPRLLLEK